MVLATGCFNVLHPGHIELFEYAHLFGPLTVGINGHAYNLKRNGDKTVSLQHRIYMIRSIRYVNDVVVFEEPTPCELIERLKPCFFVKGPDYKNKDIPELPVCQRIGTEVLIQPAVKIYNSSELATLVKE